MPEFASLPKRNSLRRGADPFASSGTPAPVRNHRQEPEPQERPGLARASPEARPSKAPAAANLEAPPGAARCGAVAPHGRPSDSGAAGETCEKGVWNLTENPSLTFSKPPSPALPPGS